MSRYSHPIQLFLFCVLVFIAPVTKSGDQVTSAADRHIPFKTQEEATGALVWRVVLGLGFVLAIGAGTIVLLKKYIPSLGITADPSGSQKINLAGVRRLSPKLIIYVIHIESERYVIAQSGDRLLQLSASTAKQ